MRKINGFLVPALAGLLALTLASGANAQVVNTICFEDAIPLTQTNWGPGGPPSPLEVPMFDTSLGTLTSISITFGGEVISSFDVDNESPQTESVGTATAQSRLRLFDPSNNEILVVTPASAAVAFGPLAVDEATDGNGDFAGPDATTLADVAGSGSENLILTDAGSLALFSGAGNIALPVEARAQSFVEENTGNFASLILTSASANLEVCYTYTTVPQQEVPEPGAWAVMGIGLVTGLGMLRRLRK